MLKDLIPMLESDDLSKTLSFYTEILGFELVNSFKEGDTLTWMMVKKDQVELMFTSRFMKSQSKSTLFTGTFYIYPDDVNALWEEIHDKVEVAWPIQDFEYGMREFGIVDPNGYLLSFGQPLNQE